MTVRNTDSFTLQKLQCLLPNWLSPSPLYQCQLDPKADKEERDFYIVWTKVNSTILGSIKLCLSDSLKNKFMTETSTVGLIKALKDEYRKYPGGAFARQTPAIHGYHHTDDCTSKGQHWETKDSHCRGDLSGCGPVMGPAPYEGNVMLGPGRNKCRLDLNKVHPKGHPLGVWASRRTPGVLRFQRSIHSIVGQGLREIQK